MTDPAMTAPPISFTPGPVHVDAEVLAAMATPPLPHRSPEFRAVVRRVEDGLAALLATTSPVVPVLATATGAFEAALAAVARRRVLVAVNGSFGDRWAEMAGALGFDVERITFPPGEPADADAVGRAVAAGGFDAVAVVHSETSTGALSDAETIAREASRHGAATVVDAVSSLGAMPLALARFGPDAIVVGSTGKGLACPPGMAVVAVAPGAAERARAAPATGWTLRLESLLASHARGETPQTPATSLFHALDVQLGRIAREGIAARAARHEEMARIATEWADAEGLTQLAPAGSRSPAVTVVVNADGLDVPALLRDVLRRGYRIADGHGPLAGATFRVGHLGDVRPDGLRACLAAVSESLRAARR